MMHSLTNSIGRWFPGLIAFLILIVVTREGSFTSWTNQFIQKWSNKEFFENDTDTNVEAAMREMDFNESHNNNPIDLYGDKRKVCENNRGFSLQCDPTILHDISIFNRLPVNVNLKTLSQALAVSEESQKSSNRITCPRQPLLKFNSSVSCGLVSDPGSGNTWVRHVIQQLTGFMTGSSYHDPALFNNGFPGEGKSEDMIVVKTHAANETKSDGLFFDRRILLLRNPYDSALAEFKRGPLKMGHSGVTARSDRADSQTDRWEPYIDRFTRRWPEFVKSLLQDSKRPTLILFYEDLTTCLLPEIIKIANFLKTDSLTQFSVCCALKESEGQHHRNHTSDQMQVKDMYSKSQRLKMDHMLELLASQLKSAHPMIAKHIIEYRSS